MRLGVSACLLGRKVRFDGGHKKDDYLTETLGRWAEWVEVCPEVELGLGIPRPSLRLEGAPDAPRLVMQKTREDLTERMEAWARRRVEKLDGLDGYILKKDSPSCGMERVRVYGKGGVPLKTGRGLYARALMERFPLLPVEEEGRLKDPSLRENFIERVFAHRRFRTFVASRPKPKDLVAFHTSQKMALSAHDQKTYRALGRLVADAGRRPMAQLLDAYGELLMRGLARPATRAKHADVLQHLAGHLKRVLDEGDRAELAAVIGDYRNGLVPLVVPITLLRHHFRRSPSEWVAQQTYLEPYPAELMLRNRV